MTSNAFNIIFAGTPGFAAIALQALLTSSHIIKAVYTQPDRPAGRGRTLTASPVKELALAHQLPVYQPLSLCDNHEQALLAQHHADLMIVAAYGLLLPQAVLTIPRLGCINIHASLLPRWRGAAPIHRAILAGDNVTGITIMQMNKGLDTGAMLYKTESPILADDTCETLHDRLADLGAKAILTSLDLLVSGQLKAEEQVDVLATYAHKIKKEEGEINWNLSARELDRHVRAFYGWPVAYTYLFEQSLRIWQAEPLSHSSDLVAQPGTIIRLSADGIDVMTGDGILRLQKIQLPGGRILPVADILNAHHQALNLGTILGKTI